MLCDHQRKGNFYEKSFQFLFTLRKSCFNSSSWLKWLRISDRKFVIHTTEMILWSMILILQHFVIQPLLVSYTKLIWEFVIQNQDYMVMVLLWKRVIIYSWWFEQSSWRFLLDVLWGTTSGVFLGALFPKLGTFAFWAALFLNRFLAVMNILAYNINITRSGT